MHEAVWGHGAARSAVAGFPYDIAAEGIDSQSCNLAMLSNCEVTLDRSSLSDTNSPIGDGSG